MKKILLAVSGFATLFRNNIGAGEMKSGNFVRYGVGGPGGSDLIGWKSVTIDQSMIGKRVAVFCAIEIKAPGAVTDAKRLARQEHFIKTVASAGGLSGLATCVNDAWDIIA